MKSKVISVLMLSLTLTFGNFSAVQASESTYMNEQYRPQYHFTPEKNWMNDPNGMVYYKGEYHLFYQYYPDGTTWGPMHWGHAVSKDLVNWEHLPIALYPDENGDIFSGSAVVDWNNSSGFFDDTPDKSGLVAIFTHAIGAKGQQQSIAYSKDNGRTWTKYSGNPVISNPGIEDFRDPKVFWDDKDHKWVMSLAVHDRVEFYTSSNLKQWTYTGKFGDAGQGSHAGVWECPELYQIPVEGEQGKSKWVLTVSLGAGDPNNILPNPPPAGGSGMMYFIGDFNGSTFVADSSEPSWIDYGPDFYAGVSWNDTIKRSDVSNAQYGKHAPDGRRIWLGWMSNWRYATTTPTDPWRSAMSIPRELKLKNIDGALKLVQEPVSELKDIRRNPSKTLGHNEITPETNLLSNISGDTLEIEAEFNVDNKTTADEFGLKVRKRNNQETVIGYDKNNSKFFVDRSKADNFFSPSNTSQKDISQKQEVVMKPIDNKIKLHIFVDRSSVEVFGNDGLVSITDQIFPDPSSKGLELYSTGGSVILNSLKVYPLEKATFTPYVNTSLPYDESKVPNYIINHDFETGDLTGWTAEGNAFNNAVSSATTYWDSTHFFNQQGKYHLWGFGGSDDNRGVLKSNYFKLDGNGKVNLLVSGGDQSDRTYVALVRASDDKELFKATGGNTETYRKVEWDASEYVGQVLYIKVVDYAIGGWGHINIDDVNVQ